MNRLSLSLVVSIGTLLLLPVPITLMSTPPRVAAQQMPTELTPNQLRQVAGSITVKVFAKQSTGSGIVIAKLGDVYTVLTNNHVTTPGQPYSIQTPDGQIHQATLKPGISLQGNDLALLQFRASGNYAVAKIGGSSPLRVNADVFAAGFPFDSQELVLTTGRISRLQDLALKGGYRIAYTNSIQQGMSGGPLLNRQGEVIGVNGLAAEPILSNAYRFQDGSQPTAAQLQEMRRFSWAVPIQTFAQLAGLPPQSPIPNSPPLSGVMEQVNNIASQITVRIDLPDNSNGSGVIIAKQGNTYYVLTADHVVKDEAKYSVVTPDGQGYPVNSSSVKQMPGVDLAVLQFTSNRTYQVASLGKYDRGSNEPFVFVSGWPTSQPGSNVKPSRVLTAGTLTSKEFAPLVAKDSDSLNEGYELVYQDITAGGMSGGPVLDTHGRVIGIHGRADGESSLNEIGPDGLPVRIQLGYSLGIPMSTFLNLVSLLGIQQPLKVETTAPPPLTKVQADLIRKHLLPQAAIPKASAHAIDWLNYGNQLWRVGNTPSAIQAFDKAIQLQPNLYEAWYAKGSRLTNQNKYNDAILLFDKATQINENFAPAWKLRGLNLLNLSRYKEALASFDKAVKIKPNDLGNQLWRGVILLLLNQDTSARDAFSEAIKINPIAVAYRGRGDAYSRLKEYPQALADYNQAIRLKPDDAQAYASRGLVYFDLKEYQQAIADYNQAIRLKPDDATTYSNRVLVYYKLEEYQQVVANLNQVIRLKPNDVNAYKLRGTVHAVLKEYQQAIADFNQVIRLKPSDANAYNLRGTAHAVLKEYQQAIADIQKAAQLSYEQRDVANYQLAQAQLKRLQR